MDAIVDLDCDLNVALTNPAWEKAFRCSSRELIGREFAPFLTVESFQKLTGFIKDLDLQPEDQRHLWITGGLRAVCAGGEEFQAEATLSRYDVDQIPFYTTDFAKRQRPARGGA